MYKKRNLKEILSRPIILYGFGEFAYKLVKDFMYAFPSVSYKCICVDEKIDKELLSYNEYVILCTKDIGGGDVI